MIEQLNNKCWLLLAFLSIPPRVMVKHVVSVLMMGSGWVFGLSYCWGAMLCELDPGINPGV